MLQCKHGRYLLGPAASPGVRGSAPVLKPMSTQAALPLLVSVGRPGPPKPAVSRTAPQGRAQRSLTSPAMIFDPTDGGRDLHPRRLERGGGDSERGSTTAPFSTAN
jgi:hypothetical protein